MVAETAAIVTWRFLTSPERYKTLLALNTPILIRGMIDCPWTLPIDISVVIHHARVF